MNLPFDPEEAVARLARVDRQLARVIKQAGPFTLRPQKMHSPFETLLRAIVYQQLSGKAAATIMGRVVETCSTGRGVTPEGLLKVKDQRLRACGMSRAKVLAVQDLAVKTLDGTVPSLARLKRMSDEEIVERLVQVRGIGRWSVEMLLMFRLGRPDVLPIHDLGVRKGFMLTYGHTEMPKPLAVAEYAERWRPFRSVASWYMWRAVEVHSPKAAPQPLTDASPSKKPRKVAARPK